MLTPSHEPLMIDLLVMPETTLILVASVIEPLRAANRITGETLYRWRIFSPDGQPVETVSRIPVPVEGPFRPGSDSHPLFVLSSYNWRRYATPQVRMLLSRSAGHREMIAGIEAGAWLLAETSLLDGFAATTHWEDHEDFAAHYPHIQHSRERFVIDRKRITTGGSLPTLDLMLDIIRRRQGYSLALEVSRLFIYDQGVTQGSVHAVPKAGGLRVTDERVSQAVRLMEENIAEPLSLPRIAKRVGLSTRRLQTLFRDTIGINPHIHYLALRLNAARRRVIETALPLADIAVETGFNSASSFARSYKGQYRESPSETRKRLQGRAG